MEFIPGVDYCASNNNRRILLTINGQNIFENVILFIAYDGRLMVGWW